MIIGIFGAQGQMGKVLTKLYGEERPEIQILAMGRNHQELPPAGPHPDVVIDFSHKDALESVLSLCTRNQIPLVLATTGYDAADKAKIEKASQEIPIFQSANLSLGVHVLKTLAREAARLLGESADIEIIEKHHNRKKDAPSGTALLLLDAVTKEGESHKTVHGREGQSLREKGEIGIHAVRGGTLVGEHTLLFALESESLELTHRGESKRLFAKGAMKAADYIITQAPGLYGMDDLFGGGMIHE
jgi:4-hydroxy-tetrahydrodipicolinate reductase